jgi:hypothetical protein
MGGIMAFHLPRFVKIRRIRLSMADLFAALWWHAA